MSCVAGVLNKRRSAGVECPASLGGLTGSSPIPHAGISAHHGRPRPLLLPESRLRPPRATGGRQPLRLRPLRQAATHPPALLPRVQGPLLRAQGDAALRLPAPRREGPFHPSSP